MWERDNRSLLYGDKDKGRQEKETIEKGESRKKTNTQKHAETENIIVHGNKVSIL